MQKITIEYHVCQYCTFSSWDMAEAKEHEHDTIRIRRKVLVPNHAFPPQGVVDSETPIGRGY